MKKSGARKVFASLSLAFSCAAAPVLAADDIEKAEGLWKVEYVNAVIRIEKCPEKTACASLYWVDPDDVRIYDNLADPREKQKKSWGDAVSREEIMALCGFSPNMDIRPAANGGWEGTLEARGIGMTANVSIAMTGPNEMKVVGSKFFFTHEEKWQRIQPDDKRYPACKKPSL